MYHCQLIAAELARIEKESNTRVALTHLIESAIMSPSERTEEDVFNIVDFCKNVKTPSNQTPLVSLRSKNLFFDRKIYFFDADMPAPLSAQSRSLEAFPLPPMVTGHSAPVCVLSTQKLRSLLAADPQLHYRPCPCQCHRVEIGARPTS